MRLCRTTSVNLSVRVTRKIKQRLSPIHRLVAERRVSDYCIKVFLGNMG